MKKEIINYHNKLLTTKNNINISISNFSGDLFYSIEDITNEIFKLINIKEFDNKKQYLRTKRLLKNILYVLFNLKGNDFDITDIDIMLTNHLGEGKINIDKFLKIPTKNTFEQKMQYDISIFFLDIYFKDKDYSEDSEALRYYIRELMFV